MIAQLRHGGLIIRTYVRLGMLNFMQYRGEFLIAVINAVITLLAQVIGLWVIFSQTATLDGWTSAGMMLLVGIHFLISGLIGMVIRPSVEAMMEGIRLGTFDFTLTKPADSQLLASVQTVSPVQDFPPERFSFILRLMVEAPFRVVRGALPHMYGRGWGRIVNISSVHGLRASAYKSAYVTAKHGLEGFSKVVALEGAPHGVTSNCVNPGYVRTALVEKQIADQAAALH
jgi:hypothetical protein